MKIHEISDEQEYKQAFSKLDALIADNFEGNSEKEKEYRSIAESIQKYEQTHYHFPVPTTLVGMIEMKMFEMKLKQRDLAQILEVKESRLSEVLNGKRKINLELATKLYQKLHIDASFILNAA